MMMSVCVVRKIAPEEGSVLRRTRYGAFGGVPLALYYLYWTARVRSPDRCLAKPVCTVHSGLQVCI